MAASEPITNLTELITAGDNDPLAIVDLTVPETKKIKFINLLGGIKVVKVSLTTAQVLASNGTPIQAVAAPGAGKAIEAISMVSSLAFNTIAYATNTNFIAITDTA